MTAEYASSDQAVLVVETLFYRLMLIPTAHNTVFLPPDTQC